MKKFAFITSTRFWFIGIASVTFGLWHGGIFPTEVAAPLITWALGAAGIRTVDRFSETLK